MDKSDVTQSESDSFSVTTEVARAMLDKIKDGLTRLEHGIEVMIEHEIWLPLGYDSFEDMFTAEGMAEFRLSPAVRRVAIERMKADNPSVSNRKVAKVLGISEGTVRNVTHPGRSTAPNDAVADSGAFGPPVVIEGEIVADREQHCPTCQCG